MSDLRGLFFRLPATGLNGMDPQKFLRMAALGLDDEILKSDWNKDFKIKFTVQDPCQIVRKSYGDPIAEDLRDDLKEAAVYGA